MSRLVIISGARRGIGKTYFDYFSNQENTIGLSSTDSNGFVKLNLLNEKDISSFVDNLSFERVSEILYIHSLGPDYFEPEGKPYLDKDGDGIDDRVYESNAQMFFNLVNPLFEETLNQNIPVTTLNFGSISDVYMVPFWQSFSKSKNDVRKYMKSINSDMIKSIFLNISSTLDEDSQTFGRKFADITYWQTSQELLQKSMGVINNPQLISSNHFEMDIYKFNPNYRKDHFINLPRLYAIWQKDMGFENKPIPPNIRI